MKAISIRQPYAYAITRGFKLVENRSWPTHFRGPVLIHAGKKEESDDVESVIRSIASSANMPDREIAATYTKCRRLGGIVGAARIVNCVTESDDPWFYGPYGFVLDSPVPTIDFVPCKGALGFFEVPAAVISKVVLPPDARHLLMGAA